MMNAIILAAGLGSRFKDITIHTHKALLPIKGVPNIEHTINYLKKSNINDIYIIVGHLSEQFEYLKEKYNCKLIYNSKYKEYNNIYSFYLAKDFFGDSYVIDSDVVLFSNIFNTALTNSTYYLIKRPKSKYKEWIPHFENDIITKIDISNKEEYSLLGVSFWNKNDSVIIKKEIEKLYTKEESFTNDKLYWDNIPMSLLPLLKVEAIKLEISQAYEMDRLEDYELITKNIIQ